MAGKCEHGLTTRECMACASPKYGAETGDRWVTIPRARLAELEAAEAEVQTYRDQAHRVPSLHAPNRGARPRQRAVSAAAMRDCLKRPNDRLT
jgi:hypothetical protein